MSTSANPALASSSPTTQVILHSALKVAQVGGMAVPPIYLVLAAFRGKKPFTIKRLMNASTLGVGAGAGIGAGMAALKMRDQSELAIIDRVERLKRNATQVEADDYSIIGAVVGSLLTSAVLKNRAPLPFLLLGGASIGLGAGVWVHLAQAYQRGEDVRPEGMVGELPVVGGNDRK